MFQVPHSCMLVSAQEEDTQTLSCFSRQTLYFESQAIIPPDLYTTSCRNRKEMEDGSDGEREKEEEEKDKALSYSKFSILT